jgi:hypothetical protein
MGYPAVTKTWTITPNNRISFVSLNDTMANYLYGVKTFLKANGYTVAGSSNGTTGAMDATDRWSTSANATTRGAGSGNAQSWIVLVDANGVQILLTYQGASDNTGRLSMSVGALFVAAGTPQNQPTATDEAILVSATDLVDSNASADRVWAGWVDATHKCCRFAIFRLGNTTGAMWGVERVNPTVQTPALAWSPAVWGFGFSGSSATLGNGSTVGAARVNLASIGVSVSIGFGMEYIYNSSAPFTTIQPEAQGGPGYGYPMFPLSIGSNSGTVRGKFGDLVDWWQGRTSGGVDGDLANGKQFIGLGGIAANVGACIWPWDNTTTPVLT